MSEPTVRILYCRSRDIFSPLLRAAMWSPWSHEALVIGDEEDTVIDATFRNGGVRRRSLSAVLAHSSRHEFRDISCPYPVLAYNFARSQIGVPYDTWGVLGIGLHRDWQAEDAWFCSEFAEAAVAAGGNQRFVNYPRRVNPQHSWMVK
jgi:hypothetical protein